MTLKAMDSLDLVEAVMLVEEIFEVDIPSGGPTHGLLPT